MSIRIVKVLDNAMLVTSIALNDRMIGVLVKDHPKAPGWSFAPSGDLVYKLTTLKDILAAMQTLTDADTKAERDEANRREIARLQADIDGIVARDDEDYD